MKNFKGTTAKDIYSFPHINLPMYPLEGEIKPSNRFYYSLMNEISRDFSASTLIPVSNGLNYLVLPYSTRLMELFDYYQYTYGKECVGDLNNLVFTDNKKYKEVAERLAQQTGKKIISHLPYIDEKFSYYDPEKQAYLNSKKNLEFLTTAIPKRVVVHSDLLKTVLSEMDFPVYLKGVHGIGGNYVVKLNSIKEFENHSKLLSLMSEVVIEERFEHDLNFNVQCCISSAGELSFLGYSTQLLSETLHIGNCVYLNSTFEHLPAPVQLITEEACQSAYRLGYSGLVGLDILYRQRDNRAVLIDPNFRWNGSTTANLLGNIIFEKTKQNYMFWLGFSTTRYEKFSDLLTKFRRHLDNGEIFIIGGVNREMENNFVLGLALVGSRLVDLEENRKFCLENL